MIFNHNLKGDRFIYFALKQWVKDAEDMLEANDGENPDPDGFPLDYNDTMVIQCILKSMEKEADKTRRENVVDFAIEQSNTPEEFLSILKENGLKIKGL